MNVFEHYTDMEVNKVGYTSYFCDKNYAIYLRKTKPYKINFRKELVITIRYRRENKNSMSSDMFYYWLYTRQV